MTLAAARRRTVASVASVAGAALLLLLPGGPSSSSAAATDGLFVDADDSASPSSWAAAVSRTASALAESRMRGRREEEEGKRRRRTTDFPEDASELRTCGDVIGLHSKDEIKSVADAVVEGALPGMAAMASPIIGESIKFSIRSRKICATCKEVMELFGTELNLMDTAGAADGFLSYCGPDVVGHESVFSGLLLEPIDDDTGLPPVGKVKASVWTKGSNTEKFKIPSEVWPTSFGDVLASASADGTNIIEVLADYIDLVGPIMGATSGTYALIADGKGYGEDYEGKVGYLIKRSYQTSLVPLWLHAKDYVRSSTNGCTVLDDVASLGGYSIGAYAAVAEAAALHALGVEIVRVSAGGGPFRVSSAVPLENMKTIEDGNWPPFANFLPALVGYAYSSTDPHLPNTNTGQNLLSDEWMDGDVFEKNVVAWIDDGLEGIVEIGALMPSNPLDIYDQNAMALFRNAVVNDVPYPCLTDDVEEGVNDKLCEAFLENDLTEALEASPFPIQFCHSPDDEIVSIKNLPNVTDNPNLSVASFPTPTGTHLEAMLVCILASLLPFTSLGDPAEVAGIDPHDEEGACMPGANVPPPTSAPAPAPTASGADPPTSPEDDGSRGGDTFSSAVSAGGFFGAVVGPLFAVLPLLFW